MTKEKVLCYAKKTLMVLFITLFLLSAVGTVAHATGLIDDTVNSSNLYSKYGLEHYQLDFFVDNSWAWLPWNWVDGIGKSVTYGFYCITSFIWTISMYLSNATGYAVQEAYRLDFIDGLSDVIGNGIQTLSGISPRGFSSDGLYVGFLGWIVAVVGIYVAYTGLMKHEVSKAVSAVVSFVVIFLMSSCFIVYAPSMIRNINEFSSDLSTAVLDLGSKITIDGNTGGNRDSVDMIRDNLFSIQIEKPWLLLQYGNADKESLGNRRVEKLLSTSPNENKGKDREELVKAEVEEKDNGYMTITHAVSRMGMAVFLFIFNLGISVFVLLLTGMKIFAQVQFIIYALFLPVAFVLSMFPNFSNMSKGAVLKVFNTIMMGAGITLVMTFAFSISALLYEASSRYPFFLTAFLQIVLFFGVYSKLGEILGMMNLRDDNSTRGMRRFIYRPYRMANRKIRHMGRKGAMAMAVTGAVAGGAKEIEKTVSQSTGGNHASRKHEYSREKGRTETFAENMGRKTANVMDSVNVIKDKAQTVRENVKNAPLNARYALHEKKQQISDTMQTGTENFRSEMERQKAKNQYHRENVKMNRDMSVERKKQKLGIGSSPVHKDMENPRKRAETVERAVSQSENVGKGMNVSESVKNAEQLKRPNVSQKDSALQHAERRMEKRQNTDIRRPQTEAVKDSSVHAYADGNRETAQMQRPLERKIQKEYTDNVQQKERPVTQTKTVCRAVSQTDNGTQAKTEREIRTNSVSQRQQTVRERKTSVQTESRAERIQERRTVRRNRHKETEKRK